MIRTLMLILASIVASPVVAQVELVTVPPRRAEVGSDVSFAWRPLPPGLQTRHRLDMPGDWKFGLKYAMNRWSEWGTETSVTYGRFVLNGRYRFTVEMRRPDGSVGSVSHDFELHFTPPELRDEAIRINWAKVGSAPSKREQYQILADEYRQAYDYWIREYDGERRKLDLMWSGEEFVRTVSGPIAEKGVEELIAAADRKAAARVGRILAPIMLYQFVKDAGQQAGLDLLLIYQNGRTNRAAFSALTAYWAWHGYERLARRSD